MKSAKQFLVLFLVLVTLIACNPTPEIIVVEVTSTPRPTDIPTNTSEPTATSTPLTPTDTPQPTNTPRPTRTPRPTNTPKPTNTPTPTPAPIILSGNGDAVVDVEKWDGPAIVHITNSGGRNFAIWNYGADNEKIDLLVNVIGKYEGSRPLDWNDDEHTTRFQVESSGNWEIQVLPFEQMRIVTIPGTFEGTGDDVVALVGSNAPDILKIDASTAGKNFAIWGWGNERDLLINEIAPYTGNILVDSKLPASNGVLVLDIAATGNWSIEVTTR